MRPVCVFPDRPRSGVHRLCVILAPVKFLTCLGPYILPTLLRLFIADADLAGSLAGELEWRLLDGPSVRPGKTSLSQLPPARYLEVFLPASTVLKATPQLPPGGHRQARKLLPYALDNLLLADAAQQHIAFIAQAGQCRVAAVDRALLAGVLEALTQHQLKPRAIWSEADLAPAAGVCVFRRPGGWVAAQDAAVLWFDDKEGKSCPPLLAQWLSRIESEVCLVVDPAQASQLLMESWEAACPQLYLETRDVLAAPLSSHAVSLLQGEFAVGTHFEIDWSKLRLTGQLAVWAMALWLVVTLGSVWAMRSEEKNLRNHINRSFQAAFPSEPLVDARRQVQVRLQPSNSGAAGLDGLSRLETLAAQLAPVAGPPLERLELQQNTLILDYRAPPEQMTTLTAALGVHYQATRTSPASGIERVLLKPRP